MIREEGENERQILEALIVNALHLPRMPTQHDSPPVLRILVVADVDLPSASALAEFSLQQNNLVFDASMMDLCIACGSFARDEDLLPYLKGNTRESRQNEQRECTGAWTATPFFRSREETAALEGLMTGALSQLESIVCRVVYCPGSEDPVTTLFSDRYRRLTPNSRNIYQQWMPLAPGIGCAALLYLDSAEAAMKNASSPRSRVNDDNEDDDDTSDRCGDEDDDEDEDDESSFPAWSEELLQIHRSISSKGYCRSLERLVELAPSSSHPVPFTNAVCQTILVTHYVDCHSDHLSSDSTSTEPSLSNATSQTIKRPWDVEQHASFAQSPLSEKLLCLEIASGSAASHKPELIEEGACQVLLPGSLRERGEFCILEVVLLEDEKKENCSSSRSVKLLKEIRRPESSPTSSTNNTKRTFAWKVQKVDFHRMGRFRERI